MSTSPLVMQSGGANTNGNLPCAGSGLASIEMDEQQPASASEDIHVNLESRKTCNSEKLLPRGETNERKRSGRPASVSNVIWELPGSSATDYDPVTDGRKSGVNTSRSRTSRSKTHETTASKRSSKSVKGAMLCGVEDEYSDGWQPGPSLEALQEPSNTRLTRRNGSVGLLDGLNKRKRQRQVFDLDSGSATEASRALKKTNSSDSRLSPREPSILVDLAKSDTVLSNSQRQQYEQLHVDASSSVDQGSIPLPEEHVYLDPFADYPDQSSTVPNTETPTIPVKAFLDTGDGASSAVAKTDGRSSSTENLSKTVRLDVGEIGNSATRWHSPETKTSIDPSGQVPSNFELRDTQSSESKHSRLGQSEIGVQSSQESSTIIVITKKPAKSKRKMLKAGSRQKQFSEEDQLMADGIGLPPEQYAPRPSRSRARPIIDDEKSSTNVESVSNWDSQNSALTAVESRTTMKAKRRQNKSQTVEKGASAINDEEAGMRDDRMSVQSADQIKEKDRSITVPKKGKKRKAKMEDYRSGATPTETSENAKMKAESDIARQSQMPLAEVDDNTGPLSAEPLVSSKAAPSTPVGSKPCEAATLASPTADHSTTSCTTPTTTLPPSPQKRATPHSPLNNGKKPYRVGLSKRVKIQPLLRMMKR